jgi:signal peptidase
MSESDAGPDRRSEERTDGAGSDRPDRAAVATEDRPSSPTEWARWLLTTDHNGISYVREVLSSVAAVLLVGLLLFAVSGLWPPMVAVESPSMNPNLKTGDLVFVMEEHRFAGGAAYADTGVVTYRSGRAADYAKFNRYGDVIVFQPSGNAGQTPIIHRAMFHVNESENWYDKAVAVDSRAVGSADDCEELRACPAPNAGFITKGDNERTNVQYDQVSGLSAPVKPAWVVGTAEFRIPLLGNIRLWASRAGVVAAPPEPWASPPSADGAANATWTPERDAAPPTPVAP